MLQLVTTIPQHLILDLDTAFAELTYRQFGFMFDQILRLSNATCSIPLKSIPEDMTPEAIGIRTQFGYTNLNNIPNGVKAYTLACIALRNNRKIYLPECAIGYTIRKALVKLCRYNDNVVLYAPQGYFTSAYTPTRDICKVTVCLDGEVKELPC